MASESLQKCVIACQPFKDGVATLICSGCKRLMAFPSGASRVRCAGCSTITSGFRINCTSCREPLKIFLKDRESKCHSCGYVFTPLTTFKIPGASGNPAGIAKLANDKIAAIKIIAHENLAPTAKEGIIAKLNLLKPLSCQLKEWEQALGVSSLSDATFTYKGDSLDLSLTGKQIGIESGGTLACAKREGGGGSQAGGHIFIQASFSQPTNCAYCKKFIWGLYNQGKRCAQCSAPIHHRCAAQFTQICEAALRQSIGLSIAQLGNEDEMDDSDEPMEGQPIQKEDVAEWEALLSETVCPENDSACMSIFDKFEDFTDEDINRLWKKYDRDGNGELDHAEMRLLVLDMLGKTSDNQNAEVEQELEDLIRRVTNAMDTSRDGLVQWDEFHSFYKAQLDSSFIRSLQGVPFNVETINELWYHYDADNSGSLEADELLKLIHDCAMLHEAGEEKKQAMKSYRGKLDSLIGPGAKVTWEQFCSQILPIIQPMISGEACDEEQEL